MKAIPRNLLRLAPFMPTRHSWLVAGGLIASGMAALLLSPTPVRAEVLYKLDTMCSVKGGAPQPCTVEAIDEGDATLYRHTIGKTVATIRVTDQPVTMALQKPGGGWMTLVNAGARFSTNTICFNNRDLCVVNPNYLNSVREDNPDSMDGRDLVIVHFNQAGRVNVSCYDDGCDVVKHEVDKK
ncbi:hypothetical protein IFHNHDMJ_01371 [Synechococcus sp. CBW1107]|nr:hypothetical protein IFHNHDMJ_01371 [Synechococcus sp. CBW1107]